MDFMNSFPGSWSLVRKNLPTLIGAGVGAVAGSFAAGRRAYQQIQKDNQQSRLPTWSSRAKMPSLGVRRVGGMRRPLLRRRRNYMRRSKGMSPNSFKRFVRSTTVNGIAVNAATTSFLSTNVTLSQVQTSDLTSIYRLYRIRKVVMHLVPRVDPANSGVVNNYQALVAAACDPENTTTPTSIIGITAYDNSYQKFLNAADKFTYTFYPKVTNSIDISGVATAAGSYAMNPWIRLDSTGVTVPHLSLKLGFNVGASTTVAFDYYYDIHFDTRGIA